MKYRVSIREIFETTVEVLATDENEARDKVEAILHNCGLKGFRSYIR